MAAEREAYLAMIQGVINRLAQNSFLLKGWSVLLVSALLAVAASSSEDWILPVAFLPTVAFWGLDGYYLRQEGLFRRLYDHARQAGEADVDYSMDTGPFQTEVRWRSVVVSRTLSAFHGTLVAAVLIVTIIAFTQS
ncbi:MAG: hypothetical protein F4236_00405 [Acidimicrobiia bacterium]|nr:hypothetical protein [Acidimicrobiia bacterium]MYE66688.1 hypothetical protein [Acidimicrobiia bacterium]